MAIKRQLHGYSGMRLDFPHLRSIESSVSNDFDELLRGLITGLSVPYVIRGFEVVIPTYAISASSLTLKVADSAILHPTATESGTILYVPSGTPDIVLDSSNPRILGSFQNGVPNFISLDLRRTTDTSTIDQTAGWSQAQKLQYQRTSPIGRILDYRIIISTSGFGNNCPLYIVGVTGGSTGGSVQYITKASNNLFRLGSGGANPDPQHRFAWGNLSNSQSLDPRREWINEDLSIPTTNPVTVTPGAPSEAFNYGDFSIRNLKEFLDGVMTRFCEITDSSYWYLNSGSLVPEANLNDLWWDSVGSVMTGNGYLSYNLILEGSLPSTGAFESQFTDSGVLVGDSYVQGATSGTKATVTAFNASRLIINSMTKSAFVYGETLYNRRLYRPSLSYWQLRDYDDTVYRWGRFDRKSIAPVSPVSVTSWSYTQNVQTVSTVSQSGSAVVTATFAGPHGFSVHQLIKVTGTGEAHLDNQWFIVDSVPLSNTLTFTSSLSATYSVAVGTIKDGFARVTITAPGHTKQVGDYVATTGLTASGGNNPNGVYLVNTVNGNDITFYVQLIPSGVPSVFAATVSTDSNVRHPYLPRFSVTAWNFVSTAITLTISNHNFIAGQKIIVSGLTGSGTTNIPNGIFTITSVTTTTVTFTAGAAPVGTNKTVTSTSFARYENHLFIASVNDAIPDTYNRTNILMYACDDAQSFYVVGSSSLPALSDGSGPIKIDGVVAVSTVLDPVMVQDMTLVGGVSSFIMTVNTFTPHGLTSTGPTNITIYGDQSLSSLIRTYENISIIYVSPTQFQVVSAAYTLPSDTYTNSGSDKTFSRFADNPYPGPIQWSSDMYIKGIIGDKYFKIPQTALADGTTTANIFNTNGLTGTAYLLDGEVAYIELERNESVSSGALFSTLGGSAGITGGIPLDKNGSPLKSGDFVKFDSESETYWLRIAGAEGTPATSPFYLVTDHNQSPTTLQRPVKTGRLVYCKGVYNTVHVEPHWLVPASADVYWLAVRRDNHSLNSKVYLKALELEAGEVREINDNEPSNLLIYTGAKTEAAVNPNYTVSDTSGSYQESEAVEIYSIDVDTRMVTFVSAPDLGFQKKDFITQGMLTWTIDQVLTSRTVTIKEDVSVMSTGAAIYYRVNYNINDSDNLTLGIRKEDRELAKVNTGITRPVYDESSFIQKIRFAVDWTGGDRLVRSGSLMYLGSKTSPTALAWVLHGTEDINDAGLPVTEDIEGFAIVMPGGHTSLLEGAVWSALTTYSIGQVVKYTYLAGATSVTKDFKKIASGGLGVDPRTGLGTMWQELGYALVQLYNGTFTGTVYQNGVASGCAIDGTFSAPSIYGDNSSTGVELVLPPNRRTQTVGSSYVVFPTHMTYHASIDPVMCGEELLVIINDQPRQANVDYAETFGGPKGKIQLIRTTPPNTRLRARTLASYGSALAAKPAGVDLQTAYNAGNVIIAATGRPVDIRSTGAATGETAVKVRGSITINGSDGGSGVSGGILGESDKIFKIGQEDNKPIDVWTAESNVKTHNSHPGSSLRTFTAADTVTLASAVVSGSNIPILEGYNYRIKINATARRSDGTFGVATFVSEGDFYREVASPVFAAGSPSTTIIGFAGDGIDYAIAFGLIDAGSGYDDTVVAVVYGNGTVQWSLSFEIQAVGPAA